MWSITIGTEQHVEPNTVIPNGAFELRITSVGAIELTDTICTFPHRHITVKIYHTSSGRCNSFVKDKVVRTLKLRYPNLSIPYCEPTRSERNWERYQFKNLDGNPDNNDKELQCVQKLVAKHLMQSDDDLMVRIGNEIGVFRAQKYIPVLSMLRNRAHDVNRVCPPTTKSAKEVMALFLSRIGSFLFVSASDRF